MPTHPQRRALRKLSLSAGLTLLVASAVSPLVFWFGLAQLPSLEKIMDSNFLMILGGLVMFVPATALGLRLLPAWQRKQALPFFKPENKPVAVFFAGVAICYWGNFVTAFIVSMGARAGVEFHAPPMDTPQSALSLLLMMVGVAVIPGVMEELLLRGVIMQPLRIYGEGFAVVCSATLFALMHMNMHQAPMAFVSGLALGWAAIRCKGLWVPIFIHFWNNAAVVLLRFLSERLSEGAFGAISLGYIIGITVLGAISLFVVVNTPKQRRFTRPQAIAPAPRAALYLLGSIPMVLSLLWYFWGIWQMTN